MATLPDTPVNTALTIGGLAALGLVAFVTHNKTKLDSQNLANYREFKAMDTDVQLGEPRHSSMPDRSIRPA
jgi:hypothetical protein